MFDHSPLQVTPLESDLANESVTVEVAGVDAFGDVSKDIVDVYRLLVGSEASELKSLLSELRTYFAIVERTARQQFSCARRSAVEQKSK